MANEFIYADIAHVEDMLAERMTYFNTYDLERLEQCFANELRYRPEHAVELNDILTHIRDEIASRK